MAVYSQEINLDQDTKKKATQLRVAFFILGKIIYSITSSSVSSSEIPSIYLQ
jgi:hypothetical protein